MSPLAAGRALLATMQSETRRVLRGLSVPLVLGVFVLLASLGATAANAGSTDALRLRLAELGEMSGMTLVLFAILLGTGGAAGRRRAPRGAAGRAATALGQGLSKGVLLVAVGGSLAFVGLTFLTVRHGSPEEPREPPVLRETLGTFPAAIRLLSPKAPTLRLELPLPADRPAASALGLHLAPEVLFVRGEAAGAGGSLRSPTRVRIFAGEQLVLRRVLNFQRGRAERFRVGTFGDFPTGVLSLELTRDEPGFALRLQPRSVAVLGGPASVSAALVRATLAQALAAWALALLVQWLSGFVRTAIARLAGGVLMLGTLWLGFGPGLPLTSSVARFRDGMGYAWPDLWPTALGAAACWLLVALLAYGDRRLAVLGDDA